MGKSVKIRLLISRAGLVGAQNAGSVIDVGVAEAKRMIAAGQAKPLRKERAIRRAPKAVEQAVK